jgi:hypothetical protein
MHSPAGIVSQKKATVECNPPPGGGGFEPARKKNIARRYLLRATRKIIDCRPTIYQKFFESGER